MSHPAAPSATGPGKGPVGRHVDVWLTLTRVGRGPGSPPAFLVADAYAPGGGWTSCRLPRHAAALPTRAEVRAEVRGGAEGPPGVVALDCACDVVCPRCRAGVGTNCTTLDGGGSSGGGYPTRTHAVRVRASGRCQALRDGSMSPCDLGAHRWQAHPSADHDPSAARCVLCNRVEPIRTTRAPLFSSNHWLR